MSGMLSHRSDIVKFIDDWARFPLLDAFFDANADRWVDVMFVVSTWVR